jgi:outer membrane protein OmpA-like peptidoglycan-associated protein
MRVWLALLLACHADAAAPQPPEGHGPPPTPRGPRRVVTDTSVEILDQVHFAGTTIAQASYPTLDAVAATLTGNPSITLLEVDAYAPNLQLADGRARAYASYLVGKGVAPNRLLPVGNVDTNERVQLVILKRKP